MTTSTAQTRRRCGAWIYSAGHAHFRVWAPRAKRLDLVLLNDSQRNVIPMNAEAHGYFSTKQSNLSAGQRYAFSLDGGEDRPDPCSLSQPLGVPGPSAIVSPQDFSWSDQNWKGVQQSDLAIYELHVGTFTQVGTFEAIIPRLRELRELGITAIEIMPVAQFPGNRNWGYDGVLLYAAQNSYGGADGLHKLVDQAHALGMGVILDCVYNHFGPEANYLHEFGPYFTEKYKTPWGAAVNYDDAGSDAVRDFVLDNVRMWLEEFHIDGLRLDAVHAIYDLGARHLLREISDVVADVKNRTGKNKFIIAESDLNDPRIIDKHERGGHGLDAQWSDDFHHAAHAFLTGERRGYYQDYGSAETLTRTLENPFLTSGNFSPQRNRKHGAPVPDDVPLNRFIVCIQNHDQVGNRAIGDRLSTILDSPAKLRLGACLMLLSPYIPMLWMGEEYGETNPFPFFCSFNGEELKEAVRKGRASEFKDFITEGEHVPDPTTEETFRSAILQWRWPEGSSQKQLRDLYRELLHARSQWPAMKDFFHRSVSIDKNIVHLIRGESPDDLHIFFNLTDAPAPLPGVENRPMIFRSESKSFGGAGENERLQAFECIVFAAAR